MTDLSPAAHPIIPPPELIAKWVGSMCGYHEAARWGADQELEACCEFMQHENFHGFARELRAARRPKPPSLKELALEAAQRFYANGHEDCNDEEIKDDFDTIRRALEQLDD